MKLPGKVVPWLFPQWLVAACLCFSPSAVLAASGPIVFVTQTPIPYDFATIASTFANESGAVVDAPRGGDLWIRYSNGSLKNLTQAAGYGNTGFQGSGAIAVRDPAVHWNASKIIFSMVVGSPQQYSIQKYYWQLYEITGLGSGDTPVITKVANQPENFNNIMPTYGTDDAVLFVSDRPRSGSRHLYPQLDEYESTHTNTGLWRLVPSSGSLELLDHAPSGVFHPLVDSFGRVLMTRWDHMQRDQQNIQGYGAFNYADETENAARLSSSNEVYPEARSQSERTDATLNLHRFNHFFPWQINEDGTAHETLNHIGRHELHSYFDRTFNDDPNLQEFYGQISRFNQNSIDNFFHIKESPTSPGTYYGINAPEFQTHAAGQIVRLSAPPTLPADQISVTYVTAEATSSPSDNPGPSHSGLYRNPLPLSDGTLIAAHTSETREDRNDGTRAQPSSRYAFRLKTMRQSNGEWVADAPLTSGIQETISFYDPDVLVSFSGAMWELQPVELVARSVPARRSEELETPELTIFSQEGINPEDFRNYLRNNRLAVIVTRNVTSRDVLDVQQPFNVRVSGGGVEKKPRSGKVYDVAHLQLFQGDQIRGYGGVDDPRSGRRVLPQLLHDGFSVNPARTGTPSSSVNVASDGSVAAFVPVKRALTWQLIDNQGKGIIRERYWLTFQPGEIRVCASCHGLSSRDQTGAGVPSNPPEALRTLLRHWRDGGTNLPVNPNPDPITGPNPPAGDTPTDPGDSDPGDSAVNVELSVSTKVRRNVLLDTMLAKKSIEIGMSSADVSAAGLNFQLQFFVDGAACPGTTRVFTASAAGAATMSGKAPSVRRDAVVTVTAVTAGTEAGREEVYLQSGKRKQKPGVFSAKELKKICGSLNKFKAPKLKRR